MLTWKYTLPAFIVPFMFTLSPEGIGLLLKGSLANALWVTGTAVVGITALVSGVGGWMVRRTTVPERVLLIASGLLLIYPGFADHLGLALGAVAAAMQLYRARRGVAIHTSPDY